VHVNLLVIVLYLRFGRQNERFVLGYIDKNYIFWRSSKICVPLRVCCIFIMVSLQVRNMIMAGAIF
jgi:hypothetical protein